MLKRYGDRSRFAVEVGDLVEEAAAARRVDVWAAGRLLTCDDNNVYVPHFAGMLQHEVRSLLSAPNHAGAGRPDPGLSPEENHGRLCVDAESDNTEYLAYRFMDWGPTADNVRMHLFREREIAFLPFSFHRASHHDPSELGRVFMAELPEWELARVLHDAAWALIWGWANRCG